MVPTGAIRRRSISISRKAKNPAVAPPRISAIFRQRARDEAAARGRGRAPFCGKALQACARRCCRDRLGRGQLFGGRRRFWRLLLRPEQPLCFAAGQFRRIHGKPEKRIIQQSFVFPKEETAFCRPGASLNQQDNGSCLGKQFSRKFRFPRESVQERSFPNPVISHGGVGRCPDRRSDLPAVKVARGRLLSTSVPLGVARPKRIPC